MSTNTADSTLSKEGDFDSANKKFPRTLLFDQRVEFTEYPISHLPREAMLCISLVGYRKSSRLPGSTNGGMLVAWANYPLFDARGYLRQGDKLIGLWPAIPGISPEYRSTFSQPNRSQQCYAVQILFQENNFNIQFPTIPLDDYVVMKNDDQSELDGFNSICPEACDAAIHASRAFILHCISNRVAKESGQRCLRAYSEASASSTDRARGPGKGYARLPPLHVWNSSQSANTYHLGETDPRSRDRSTSITFSGTKSTNDFIQCIPQHNNAYVEVLWNLKPHLLSTPETMVGLAVAAPICWPYECREALNNHQATSSDRSVWSSVLCPVYSLLSLSVKPSPALVLRLLNADVADQGIRHWAVNCLATAPPDVVEFFIPQLLEAINFDLHLDWSGLLTLMLGFSISSVRFSTALFWQLQIALSHSVWHGNHRLLLLRSALRYIVSDKLSSSWELQRKFTNRLYETAMAVKRNNSQEKDSTLATNLTRLQQSLQLELRDGFARKCQRDTVYDLDGCWDPETTSVVARRISRAVYSKEKPVSYLYMPYNPGLVVNHIDVNACSYFNSATSPLRLVFHSPDASVSPVMTMFKAGDDLRIDSLSCQLIRLFDWIWLSSGLDLQLQHFKVLATGCKRGLIELVTECYTLRQIQELNGGLMGPFKEVSIQKWLQTRHTTENSFRKASENFMRTTAANCVLTYVLGVGDRHNDNILIRYSGHVFHIDFAKTFGNLQTFAGIKRDRVPFVLTKDMEYLLTSPLGRVKRMDVNTPSPNPVPFMSTVVNRGGIQRFTDLCCEAYNLLRKQSCAILNLLDMAIYMNIPDVNYTSLRSVVDALRVNASELQAKEHFTNLIRQSLQSNAAETNFFCHILAQTKVTGSTSTTTNISVEASHEKGKPKHLFSFSTWKVTMAEDGELLAIFVSEWIKIRSTIRVHNYFPMHVWRKDSNTYSVVFRTTAHLQELAHQVAKLISRPQLERLGLDAPQIISNSKSDPDEARSQVQTWVNRLLQAGEPISQSDVLYTFFHTLLVDEAYAHIQLPDTPDIQHRADTQMQMFQNDNVPEATSKLLSSPAHSKVFQLPPEEMYTTINGDNPSAVQLELQYNKAQSRLEILVKYVRNLPLLPNGEPPDTYIKLYLLSERDHKSSKQKTKVVKRSTEPVFNTLFSYKLTEQERRFGHLDVSLWSTSSSVTNFCFGRRYISIGKLQDEGSTLAWYHLLQTP